MPHVMVISSEGYFYSYNIDLENGGECSLMKQYRCVCPPVYPPLFVHILMIDPLRLAYWTQMTRQTIEKCRPRPTGVGYVQLRAAISR